MLGAKAGYCACPLHSAPPKGWADHLSHPSGLTRRHTPTLTPYKEQACSPTQPQLLPVWEPASKGACAVFTATATALIHLAEISCLASSQFLLTREDQEPCSVTKPPENLRKIESGELPNW